MVAAVITPYLKESYVRFPLSISIVALVAATSLSSCVDKKTAENSGGNASDTHVAQLTIPSGTSIEVMLNATLSSEEAKVGDGWSGSVITGLDGIPSGTVVNGTVKGVKPAQKGDRAMLDLELASIIVDGRSTPAHGGTEAIVAGSTRARNLGAIAGSAAAGALIGKAVTGTGKGAVVGAVAGAGVATGVVAASDGYQVVLKSGTPLTFTTTEAMAVRQP
jgi:hypothetical protein